MLLSHLFRYMEGDEHDDEEEDDEDEGHARSAGPDEGESIGEEDEASEADEDEA